MTIHINGQNISEIYYCDNNNTLVSVSELYNGSNLVYSANPYQPGTVIFQSAGAATQTITLPAGVYRFACTGGGGSKSTWAAGGYLWAAGGGSGATWEGDIYLLNNTDVKLYAGAAKAASYIEINGTRIITAANGKNGGTGGGGAGGKLTLNLENIEIINTIKSTNGNTGQGVTPGSSRKGGASTSTYKWGGGTDLNSGNVQAGGFRLEYIGRH